ncbi:MAG: hypothetical protein HY677_01985 [Chloroflexi bacterium]|nr:hypothetical protein [Chloroflexota bacterium]
MPNKYEREIEDLLRKLDPLLPPAPQGPGPAEGNFDKRLRTKFARLIWGISPGQLLAFALAFMVLAYVSRFAEPAVARYLVAASVLLLAWSFVVFRGRARSSSLWARWQAGLDRRLEEMSLRWQEWLRQFFEKRSR